ncbi:MAG: sigma-70 family RNA polymerase sigma factor [Bradymonadia bacterium]
MSDAAELTQLLLHARDGDRKAEEQLLPLLYDQLRNRAMAMMSRESAGHTLQPTALVHEAYVRLIGSDMPKWQNRTHFLAVCADVMRRVLVDHARARSRKKRGGDVAKVSLDVGLQLSISHDPDVLALNDVIDGLAKVNPRQARVVILRFFGGLSVAEVAEELEVSKRTVEAEWTMAKAWLRHQLTQG